MQIEVEGSLLGLIHILVGSGNRAKIVGKNKVEIVGKTECQKKSQKASK